MQAAAKPVDGASLAVFRIAFGLLMFFDAVVYLKRGWVRALYIDPAFHFSYLGFDWVKPWPGDGMMAHFIVLAIAALMVAAGLFYRIATVVLFLALAQVFLIDAAEYLNHLYLICLIAFALIFVPAHRLWSLDAIRDSSKSSPTMPACWLWLMRIQVGIPYFFGGIAKLNGDWLRGEPLGTWLAKRADFPWIGPWLTEKWVALLFSYSGLILDLAFVPLLLWKRTRLAAYVLVLCFNAMNGWLFEIGVFPWMMVAASLLFFPPEWPRFGRKARPTNHMPRVSKPVLAGIAVYLAIQVLLPLRHWPYPGDVAWTEEGHLYSWRMKLRDKQSERLAFRVRDLQSGHQWEIEPGDFLTDRQAFRMPGQPDLIHQFAIHIADEYRREYGMDVAVTVDTSVSLNGREAAVMIDPAVDLAREPRNPWHKRWITPHAGEWLPR
ncbi:HTTM domain-containing protein [Luteolibacter flavescens]|uniref:HTTM domain-containing protein n=1 Tax=Luteolibacter flavescens TaxID=1859460 RepID=A0ABT3FRY4_9BACT|nr:HTTM domain-containing protein [Luteolibacter flavescens]MCW1886335.1 HTTM domain-containing protein [Luteolibacter flavescens]